MDLLLNDLSIHGQFRDIPDFHHSIERVMTMRAIARKFGAEIYCHRSVSFAQITPDKALPQVIQTLARDKQRALMSWITRTGPFWEDTRSHDPNDFLECNGELVTDTALGEVAFGCLRGHQRQLVSLTPSSWEFSPIPVTHSIDDHDKHDVEIRNYWMEEDLEAAFQSAPTPVESWDQLSKICQNRFEHLLLSNSCFEKLKGHPFVPSAANRVLHLLDVLNILKADLNENGKWTDKANELTQTYFHGDRACFSDSSDSEKAEFRKDLTFANPENPNQRLFCPWHGKIRTPQLRIHFSWPMKQSSPLYVVYIGPKLTKR